MRHQYLLMGVQVTLHHHHMNHQQKAWHLKEIRIHTKIHPIRYQTYQLIRIKTQVCQILLRQSHLTHQMMIIINGHDVQKRTKINAGVEHILITQSKIALSLQPIYLQPRANQRSLSSNWTMIHYSAGIISYPSWIHLELYSQFFQKHTCYLWTIHIHP